MSDPTPTAAPLATSLKLKLGVTVTLSVLVATLVGTLGSQAGVPPWLSVPVTVGLALMVTQLLAAGLTAPLRQMTEAARAMARGEYGGRVQVTTADEVGELGRAFNSMADELATVDRDRRELIANVAHEVRTPLTALGAVLENLADGVVAADADHLAEARDQAERLADLVDNLLDLSRLEAGATTAQWGPVRVVDLLTRSARAVETLGRGVPIQVSVTPTDLVVSGDAGRLAQLASNLLDNATRHSPPGAVVSVRAGRRGPDSSAGAWWLEVADQGPGVPLADREPAFARFRTMSGDHGGTGLGLAIVRWVATLHGGTVAFIDPAPGDSGARVRAEFPAPAPTSHPSAPTSHPKSHGDTSPPAGHTSPSAGHTSPSAGHTSRSAVGAAGEWWPDRIPGRPRVLLAAALTGLLAGIVLPLERLGLGTLLVLTTAGAMVALVARHRRDRFVILSAPLCLLLLLPTALLDAAWISVLCVLAAVALCLIAVTRAHGVPQFVVAGLSWPASAIRGLPWLGRSIGAIRGGGVSIPVVRTAIVSVLAILVFGLLFASADALVADWIGAIVPSISWSATTVARIFIGVAVAGILLAASYLALNPPLAVAADLPPASPLKRFEWLVPVAAIDALFAVFLVAQATAFFGGEAYLRRTTGLTYADYVHQGFGQLTLITVLTLIVVALAARRVGPAARDVLWARVALGALCLMTLAVVGSALYRMHLYEQAYGFTRLRLLVSVFEGWLGVIVLGVVVAGAIRTGRWVPRFGVAAGAVALLLLALSNPDAWIARHNLERYAETGKVDWFYLAHLSKDAVPVLARQDEQTRACLQAEGAFVTETDRWNEWNLGRHRARHALNEWGTPTANQFAPGSDAFLDLAETTTCQSR